MLPIIQGHFMISVITDLFVDGGGGQRGECPPIFLVRRYSFFGYWVEEVQIKKWGESGAKGNKYLNDRFKPISPSL